MLIYINGKRTVTGYNMCLTSTEAQRYINGRTAFWVNAEVFPECAEGYEAYLDTDGTLKTRAKEEEAELPTIEDLYNNQMILMGAIAELYEAQGGGEENA